MWGAATLVTGLVASTAAGDSGGSGLLLGDDFFPWMVLAFGAAMVVGNGLALLRPPAARKGADTGRGTRPAAVDPQDGAVSERPPVGRTLVLMAFGLVAAVWGLASLLG